MPKNEEKRQGAKNTPAAQTTTTTTPAPADEKATTPAPAATGETTPAPVKSETAEEKAAREKKEKDAAEARNEAKRQATKATKNIAVSVKTILDIFETPEALALVKLPDDKMTEFRKALTTTREAFPLAFKSLTGNGVTRQRGMTAAEVQAKINESYDRLAKRELTSDTHAALVAELTAKKRRIEAANKAKADAEKEKADKAKAATDAGKSDDTKSEDRDSKPE